MNVRLQIRQKDGRIDEIVTMYRKTAEASAEFTSEMYSTEAWVVNIDGTDCKHWIHGKLKGI